MHEPVTAITDFLVGLLAWWCAWSLRQRDGEAQLSRRLWAWGLAAQGAAAWFGGLVHGFLLGPMFWRATLVLLGMATGLFVAGLGRAVLPAKAARILFILLAGKLAAYTAWIWNRSDFLPALYDQALSLLILIGFMVAGRRRVPELIPSLAVGLAALVTGGVIQYLHVGLSPYFDYNAVYHVFGAFSTWCFFRAGRAMRDGA